MWYNALRKFPSRKDCAMTLKDYRLFPDLPSPEYFTDVSCYEEFVLRTNLLGYDVDDPRFRKILFSRCGNNIFSINGRIVMCDEESPYLIAGFGQRLDSLEGLPSKVATLRIDGAKVGSLKGCPMVVEKDFDCFLSGLASLEGGPAVVGGDFNCSWNPIRSLKGAPGYVGGAFFCKETELTEGQIQAYRDFLENRDSSLVDEDGRYLPEDGK